MSMATQLLLKMLLICETCDGSGSSSGGSSGGIGGGNSGFIVDRQKMGKYRSGKCSEVVCSIYIFTYLYMYVVEVPRIPRKK